MSGNKPAQEYRAGGVSIAIWTETCDREDRSVTQHSAKIEKRYYDEKAREWKSSEVFFAGDFYRLRMLIDQTLEYMELKSRSQEAADAA